MSVSFSHCGTFIILDRGSEYIDSRCTVWDLPAHMHASRRGSAILPRTIQPKQLVYSMYWGNTTTSLQCRCAQGHLALSIRDPRYRSIAILEMMVPTYLASITPVVIFDDENTRGIRLVFICKDRQPEMMILSDTWDSLVAELRTNLQQGLSLNSADSRLNTITSMLALNSDAK